MHDILDLVPFVNRPEWGAWEPLALIMILAGGVSAFGAGLAALRGAKPFTVHVLALTSCIALACGIMGVFVPLEQPFRVWEFAAHPSFSSWTAWGAYILPLCLLSVLAVLWQSGKEQTGNRAVALAAAALGILALAYATGEVRACVGRVLWVGYWSSMVLVAAGVAAASGLVLLIWLRLRLDDFEQGVSHVAPLLTLGGLCLVLQMLCALLTLLVRAPQGYAAFVGMWWHAPEILSALLALCTLLLGSGTLGRLAVRGSFALLSAMLLLWKIIHMGEIFGRNASLYPAREAFADLLTLDALAAFGGTVGLMVVLATVLPFLLPSSSKAKQI